ncbi:MAG: baculoviral IAP repeat-containing protein [Candidatus Endonucleobacter bathymodioli]|uniref:Baculoviral IAP repeat-containing protein n=1 Tax=Candidatus Endonucleibacter bathymodioli TaxID=539814 RepID=A0AA90SZ51_9GAMM|nr:baculoviral IAP repeat-containing protein [Candidatus Endonucleobacter bathymodioli]
MNLSVILMFFYCLGIAHNLFAIIENDIEKGLSDLSINAPDIIIYGAAANNYHIENETTASNVGAIGEDYAVNSSEEVLKTSLSAKEVIATNTNSGSGIPYSTNPIPIIINNTASSVNITCIKCGKKSEHKHIYDVSKAYLHYHITNKKRDCMFDDTNKPYAHIILFNEISESSDYKQYLEKITTIVYDTLSIKDILDREQINDITPWANSVLSRINPAPTIGNNEIHRNSNPTPVIANTEVQENNDYSPESIIDNSQTTESNSKPQDDNLINTLPLLSSNDNSEPISMESAASNLSVLEETNTPQNTVEFINPGYQNACHRRYSFDNPNWTCSQQTPDDLAEAGFFYTGGRDIVRCFCCDLGLAEWDEKDNAWQEHARHSKYCWFLKREKGAEYIAAEQEEWMKVYSPKSPEYDDISTRISSYNSWR